MIMIDPKGPINPTSEGNNYIFVIFDAFSHYVTKCVQQTIMYTMPSPRYLNTGS